ncbi:MAG: hypothetical protein HY748_06225 [Elusimicrobia bacterium]|nr:hypothetical protein [Elusimicrobiota bacterium]
MMGTLADWVMAVAAVAMWWVGWRSYKLSQQVQIQADQQQKDFNDLFEAIVISNILSGPSNIGAFDQAIKAFKEKYKGQRQIFKDKP